MFFFVPTLITLLDAALATPPSAPLVSAAEQLTQYGILGVVVLACGYAIVRLQLELQRVNEARIADAKVREEQFVTVIREATTAIQANVTSHEALRDAMDEQRSTIRELANEARATGVEIKTVSTLVASLPERLKR